MSNATKVLGNLQQKLIIAESCGVQSSGILEIINLIREQRQNLSDNNRFYSEQLDYLRAVKKDLEGTIAMISMHLIPGDLL